jgi:hypothetical protein
MSSTLMAGELKLAGPFHRHLAVTSVAAIVAAISCLGYIASFALYGDSPANVTVHEPLIVTINTLIALGLATVGLMLPLITARSFPTWAALIAAAACIGNAAFAWAMATVVAHFAPLVDETTYNAVAGLAFLIGVPKMLLGVLGFGSLAVVGWARRTLPRSLAALFALAGVASLIWPVPPGGLLSSIAVLWLVFVLRRAQPRLNQTDPTVDHLSHRNG